MSIRQCDCKTSRCGITYKPFTDTKIFQCVEHGLICPFDGWQFKTGKELLEHLQNTDEDKPIFCDGRFRYGEDKINESIFELRVFMDDKIK